MFGDFEDVEAGVRFGGGGGDAVTAAAQRAIAEAQAEELRQLKAAKKAAFDSQVSFVDPRVGRARLGRAASAPANRQKVTPSDSSESLLCPAPEWGSRGPGRGPRHAVRAACAVRAESSTTRARRAALAPAATRAARAARRAAAAAAARGPRSRARRAGGAGLATSRPFTTRVRRRWWLCASAAVKTAAGASPFAPGLARAPLLLCADCVVPCCWGWCVRAVKAEMSERLARSRKALDALPAHARAALEGFRPGTYVRIRLSGTLAARPLAHCRHPRGTTLLSRCRGLEAVR